MAAIAGVALSAYSAYEGGRKEKRGIEKAEDLEATRTAEARAREADIYGETAEFRALAKEAVPLIREDVLAAQPGESQLYQRALSGGVEDIQTQLAGYGLADSSVSGKAIGEFTGELSARDAENIRQARLRLAGGATTGIPETLSAAGISTGVSGRGAPLAIEKGAVEGGLYGNLANIATAGIGAYQQQKGYEEQLGRQSDAIYASQGGYGPYRP